MVEVHPGGGGGPLGIALGDRVEDLTVVGVSKIQKLNRRVVGE